jgi:hypothetical protein
MRLTTDLGDWKTIPVRLRLAFVFIVVFGFVTGSAIGVGLLGLPVGALILANGGILGQWVFTRRRAWWPDEPGWPDDVVDRNSGAGLPAILVVDAAILSMIWLGIVRL